MGQKMNKTLAIIVTYNRKHKLRVCIESLFKQSINSFDILIINNNSTDDTKSYLEGIACKRISVINCQSNLGGAGGFNLGLKYAVEKNYTYAWLMDDDVFVKRDALEQLLIGVETINEEWGYLASTVYDENNQLCKLNLPKYKKIKQKHIAAYKQIRTSTFVSFFVKIAIVKKVGLPIKEFFIWNDDIEYALRISDKYPCFEIPQSIVVHMVDLNRGNSIATDSKDRIDRYYLAYRNEFFIYRHRGIKGLLFFTLKCFYNSMRIVFFAKEKKIERMSVLLKGIKEGIVFNPDIETFD